MLRDRNRDLRTKILEEAIGMVAHEGVGRTTMRALARRLSISPASLYQHFRNKQHLQREIAIYGFAKLQEAMGPAFGIEDPAQALATLSERYIEFGLSNPELYQIMFQTLSPLRHLGLVGDPRILEAHAQWVALFERGMQTGAFRKVDPEIEISVRWATVHGFVQLVAASRLPDAHSPADLCSLRDAAVDMILRSLRS